MKYWIQIHGNPPVAYGDSYPEVELLSVDRKVILGRARRTGLTRLQGEDFDRAVYQIKSWWGDPVFERFESRLWVLKDRHLELLSDQ